MQEEIKVEELAPASSAAEATAQASELDGAQQTAPEPPQEEPAEETENPETATPVESAEGEASQPGSFEAAVAAGEFDGSIKRGLQAALAAVQGDGAAQVGQPEASPAAAASQSETELPPRGIADDPYKFDECVISISITLLPSDGDPHGRPVVLGIRNHLDAPIVKAPIRLADLGELPQPVKDLLTEIEVALPGRFAAKVERDKKKSKINTRAAPTATTSKTTGKTPAKTAPRPGAAPGAAPAAGTAEAAPTPQLSQLKLFENAAEVG